jgi:hypothetical protein
MKILIGMAANIVFTKDKGIDSHMISFYGAFKNMNSCRIFPLSAVSPNSLGRSEKKDGL